jgi:CBS domain-containing protein
MQLKNLMTPDVEVVHPNATLQEAAETMDSLDVGSLPVCDGQKLVGMITDRDITVRATAMGLDPVNTAVREVMTDEVLYCFEDQDAQDAARMMEQKAVRRLVVLDRDMRLVGIVALGDLAVNVQDDQLTGEVLERISHPAEPDR